VTGDCCGSPNGAPPPTYSPSDLRNVARAWPADTTQPWQRLDCCCYRSPGGTPFRVQRDPAELDCSDPAALIARALKKKFAAQHRNCDSPDASRTYNDSPVSGTVGDRSECWSPSPALDEEIKPPPVHRACFLMLPFQSWGHFLVVLGLNATLKLIRSSSSSSSFLCLYFWRLLTLLLFSLVFLWTYFSGGIVGYQ